MCLLILVTMYNIFKFEYEGYLEMVKKLLSALMISTMSFGTIASEGSEIVGRVKNLVISEEAITFNLDTSNRGYEIRTQRCDEAPELTFVIYMFKGAYAENLAKFVVDSYTKEKNIMVIGNGDCYVDSIYQQETINQISIAKMV